ncbi:MAG: RidA family protein [Anaerolineaceae bacterium]|nr:RidA family protein [Anaerolineaceae bacterium]
MCDCCERKVITSDKSPKAIGPYSIGVQGGHLVFTSGQLGIDPATGNLVEGGVEAETRQALLNAQDVLQAAGSDLSFAVKNTVFLRDINDFAKMNEIYTTFFTANPPARSAFQVGALPKGAAVEIEIVAVVPCKD